jgi:hypothetical protein
MTPMISRRSFLAQTAALGASVVGGTSVWAVAGGGDPRTMTIYMSPTCGCCAKWVDHVKAAGFKTVVHEDEDMDTVKNSLGVPRDLRSCHTAQIEKYLIEGHVPAEDIASLLARKPEAAGLTAPGMPASSPGMAVPGQPHEAYDVLLFQQDGSTKVYARR